jgi:hypothetical protein
MKKTIKLTESDLTALVKRILNEVAEEPIISDKDRIFGTFGFPAGPKPATTLHGLPLTKDNVASLKQQMANYIKSSGTLATLQKFRGNTNFPIPKFITIHVGTSSSGSGKANAEAAQYRIDYLYQFVKSALDQLGVDDAIIKQIITTNTNAKYTPTSLDKNFFDKNKIKADPHEQFGYISVNAVKTAGLDTKGIQGIQGELNKASSMINNGLLDFVDEDKIVNSLLGLETFSDIKDLDDAIAAQRDSRFNGLESFINTQLFDDNDAIRTIASHFQRLAVKSNKQGDTVRLIGGKISIGLGR